jgi:hypothetical protein
LAIRQRDHEGQLWGDFVKKVPTSKMVNNIQSPQGIAARQDAR